MIYDSRWKAFVNAMKGFARWPRYRWYAFKATHSPYHCECCGTTEPGSNPYEVGTFNHTHFLKLCTTCNYDMGPCCNFGPMHMNEFEWSLESLLYALLGSPRLAYTYTQAYIRWLRRMRHIPRSLRFRLSRITYRLRLQLGLEEPF